MSTIGNDIKREEAEKIENIDYKMVTFSLAGKDYGIDIMKVKEISKAKRFTFVPNAEPYVRGVYNLRGDIISIIDLRIMFNLPAVRREDGSFEDMIILRLDEYLIGVIVDTINKVVGIHSGNIQAPHPIFGDINIKYIQGVVENEGRLYLILDVERILGGLSGQEPGIQTPRLVRSPMNDAVQAVRDTGQGESESRGVSDDASSFIVETLETFSGFFVTERNRDWLNRRFLEWKKTRSAEDLEIQLQEKAEADQFLASFYSPCTSSLWSDEYRENVKQVLKGLEVQRNLMVWNPGCAAGQETYSLAVTLRELFPESHLKIWAHDSDLMNISNAPNLLFQEEDIPESMLDYTVEGQKGVQFNKEIRDALFFEYHNVLYPNPFPDVDLILARDLLSFQERENQKVLESEFLEKLKPGGIVIVGLNEKIVSEGFEDISIGSVRAYRKNER
jgi:purine-binding chemotaxis protein CheW